MSINLLNFSENGHFRTGQVGRWHFRGKHEKQHFSVFSLEFYYILYYLPKDMGKPDMSETVKTTEKQCKTVVTQKSAKSGDFH